MVINKFHPALKSTVDYISSNFNKNCITIHINEPTLLNIKVSHKTIGRTLDIFDYIITKLAIYDVTFSIIDSELYILGKDNHRYKLSIFERTRKLWRAPTKTALEKSKEYIENKGKIRVEGSSENRKYDEYYTGNLCLVFHSKNNTTNKEWKDTAKHLIQNKMDEIISDILNIISDDHEKEEQRKINVAKEFDILRKYLASKDEFYKIEERETYLQSMIKNIQELHFLKSWHQSNSTTKNFDNYSNFKKFIDLVNTKIQDMETALSPKSIDSELEFLEIMKITDPSSIKDEKIYQLVIDYLDQECGEAPPMDWPEHIKASVERLENLMTIEEMDKHIFTKY